MKSVFEEYTSNFENEGVDEWKEAQKRYKLRLEQELAPKKIVKGFFTCKICGQKNTHHFEVQDRSGDEGASFYIYCDTPNCKGKKGWKQ